MPRLCREDNVIYPRGLGTFHEALSVATKHTACPSAELLKMSVLCPQSRSPGSDLGKPAPDQMVKNSKCSSCSSLHPCSKSFPEGTTKFERKNRRRAPLNSSHWATHFSLSLFPYL